MYKKKNKKSLLGLANLGLGAQSVYWMRSVIHYSRYITPTCPNWGPFHLSKVTTGVRKSTFKFHLEQIPSSMRSIQFLFLYVTIYLFF